MCKKAGRTEIQATDLKISIEQDAELEQCFGRFFWANTINIQNQNDVISSLPFLRGHVKGWRGGAVPETDRPDAQALIQTRTEKQTQQQTQPDAAPQTTEQPTAEQESDAKRSASVLMPTANQSAESKRGDPTTQPNSEDKHDVDAQPLSLLPLPSQPHSYEPCVSVGVSFYVAKDGAISLELKPRDFDMSR